MFRSDFFALLLALFTLRVESAPETTGAKEALGRALLEAGAEETSEAAIRALLREEFGEAETKLTSPDLKSLRQGSVPWALPLYAKALGVSLKTDPLRLSEQLDPLLEQRRQLPPAVAEALRKVVTIFPTDTKAAFLSRVDGLELTVKTTLESNPPGDYWTAHLARLLVSSHSDRHLQTLEKVTRQLAEAFRADSMVDPLLQMTKPPSLRAAIEFLDANGLPYHYDYLSRRNLYVEQFLTMIKLLLSHAQVTFGYPPGPGRILIYSDDRSIPDFGAYVSHEQAHWLLPRLWWDPQNDPSREDWVTEAATSVVREWIAASEGEPVPWTGLTGIGPTLHRWFYERGQQIAASQPTRAWEGVLRELDALPPDPRFYAQGVMIGGIAERLALETNSDDPFKTALGFVARYALEAKSPDLSEVGRIAREFRRAHGLPEESPAAGMEELLRAAGTASLYA